MFGNYKKIDEYRQYEKIKSFIVEKYSVKWNSY